MEIFLGRQPIFDVRLQVYGYELLFREGASSTSSNITDGDRATTSLIVNTFGELGLEVVTDNKLAFINFTKDLLLNLPALPKDKLVLEVLEDVAIDSELVAAIKKLTAEGYTLALDDFEFCPKWQQLLEFAKIVKLDVLSLGHERVQQQVEKLKNFNVKLIAEKIETHEELEFCKQQGFDYFQGFFLSEPKVISGGKISANKLVVMELLSGLSSSDATPQKVEKLLSKDPKLSYKLLKIINSVAYAKLNKIQSLQQAIVYMGISKLKEWARLIALTSIDNKPHELMVTTMVRAKMCELLALAKGDKPEMYFTTGLFSTLSALMDQDISGLLEKIDMADEIKEALTKQTGELGKVLGSVIAYEKSDWDELSHDFSSEQYLQSYVKSLEWANQACRAVV